MAKLNVFKTVAKGADRKSTLAMLSQVHCEGGRLWACDLDTFISAPAPEEYTDRTSYDLKGRPLAEFGGNLLEVGDIAMTAIRCPQFVGLDMAAILAKVSHAISKEETRYYLNGAYFDTEGGHLVIVATDGHRMAKLETGEPVPDGLQSVIIPRQALAILAGIKGETWRVTWNDRFAQFAGDATNIFLRTRLIDGRYPDYGRVIPKSYKSLGAYTGQAANALAIFKECQKMGEAREPSVILRGTELHVKNKTLANYQTALPADIDNPSELPREIGFNVKYLVDAMTALGADSYRLEISDAAPPVLLTSGNSKLTQVIMPLRV